MFRKMVSVLSTLAALVLACACSLPQGQNAGGDATQEPTVPIETQVALIVDATLSARTQIASAEAVTQTPVTPEFTFTPSLTPTVTNTPTPEVPMVSVSQQTNCRSGPGTVYDKLGVINVGEKAQLVGTSPTNDTWVIKLPSNPAVTCWIWGQYASVEGNRAGLPVYPIPSTPTPQFSRTPTGTLTPQVSFSLSYVTTDYCLGLYRIKFKITNTGGLTWESNRVNVTDQTLSTNLKIERDKFLYYTSECAELGDFNLEAGEVGYTTSEGFAVNPKGHDMAATVRVCSQDGMAGTCEAETIIFKP